MLKPPIYSRVGLNCCLFMGLSLKMSKTSARWFFNLSKWSPTHQEMMLATACIQPEEKERLAKFVFKKDFKSSLVGRLMMRKYVSEICDVCYKDIKFVRDDRGRPVYETLTGQNIIFNISHQGDLTVLAGEVGDILLGIDVMKLEYTGGKPLSEFFRVMNKTFSTAEWKQIYSYKTGKDQINTFCRLWSLKESYVKALGVGITIKLQDLSFKLLTPLKVGTYVRDTELYIKDEKLEGWEFEETLIDEDHCVAVATNKKIGGAAGFREVSFGFVTEKAEPLLVLDENYALDYFRKMDKTF